MQTKIILVMVLTLGCITGIPCPAAAGFWDIILGDDTQESDLADAKIYYDRAVELSNKGQYEDAASTLEKAVAVAPEYPEAWRLLVYCKLKNGRLSNAIFSAEQALDYYPSDVNILLNKGMAEELLGLYPDAIRSFETIISKEPQNEKAWYNKGFCLRWSFKHEDAIDAFTKTVEINPRNRDAWFNMGICYQALAMDKESRTCFEKALEIDPTYDAAKRALE